ncbi:MAG: hypothetical protein QGF91_00900, partial [Gammaproteobacteria bacterium]|nr:hypothetical protein [Gammaproteobacteria bacterium]
IGEGVARFLQPIFKLSKLFLVVIITALEFLGILAGDAQGRIEFPDFLVAWVLRFWPTVPVVPVKRALPAADAASRKDKQKYQKCNN